MWRIILTILLMVSLTGCPYSDDQIRVRMHINESRDNHERNRVTLNHALADKAQRWSEHLARCNCLEHSDLADDVPPGWYGLAENVGYQSDSYKLIHMHRAFMRSPHHRANILGRYNLVGTGITRRNNRIYVVHVFGLY
jgi:uncharacterized protein YkwD